MTYVCSLRMREQVLYYGVCHVSEFCCCSSFFYMLGKEGEGEVSSIQLVASPASKSCTLGLLTAKLLLFIYSFIKMFNQFCLYSPKADIFLGALQSVLIMLNIILLSFILLFKGNLVLFTPLHLF